MGMSEWNTELRTDAYPPSTISDAVKFSLSPMTSLAYDNAEEWIQQHVMNGARSAQRHSKRERCVLPEWAMTWPGGQLSGIGRNGAYASNIGRYERVFKQAFLTERLLLLPPSSQLRYVNVIPLQNLVGFDSLKRTLTSIVKQIVMRDGDNNSRQRPSFDPLRIEEYVSVALLTVASDNNAGTVHRNPGSDMINNTLEPNGQDKKRMASTFVDEVRRLEEICRCDFGWKCD